MAHQLQLEKTKYRQWAKAGLGLGYLKDGLAPFCLEVATQQQRDLLDKIQRQKSLSLPVTCGACPLRTLEPDHKKVGNKVCPFGHINCNCWFPNGKIACRNKICGAIYDQIIMNHASTPPMVSWKNTDSQLWTSDPWSIAKCFINAPGYDQKISSSDTDCTGLLHVIINNRYYHSNISCTLTGQNIFSKVRQYRNEIFHSSSMELEESESNKYIDDMISILQDGKELVNNPDAQEAVKKLQALKTEDFIITSQCMEEILRQIKEEMEKLATREEYEDLKAKLSEGNEKSNDEHTEMKKKLTEIENLMSKEKEGKAEAEKEHVELKKKLTEIENLMSKEMEGKAEAEKEHAELKKKLTDLENLMSKEKEGKAEAEKEHAELKKKLTEIENLMSKEKVGKAEVEKEHAELKKKLTEIENLMSKEMEGKAEAEKKHAELKKKLTDLENLMSKEKEGKAEAEKEHAELKKKLTEIENLMSKEKVGKAEVEKEHAELKKKLTALEVLIAKEIEEKLAAEKEYRELKKNFDKLEALVSEQKKEMKQIKEEKTDKKQTDYEQAKSDLQRQMIERYRKTLLQVPVIPTNQKTYIRSFDEIYIRPTITREVKGEKGKTEEKVVNSMSEIFTKNGVPLKTIYVLGDAGTGKSSFCKYLLNCWCKAHSEEYQDENSQHETDNLETDSDSDNNVGDHLKFKLDHENHKSDRCENEPCESDSEEYDSMNSESDSEEYDSMESHSDEIDIEELECEIKEYGNKFNGVKEMRKFDILFYIALRRYQNVVSIHEMLKKHYNSNILDELLDKESEKIIILLDGLDEWSSATITDNQFQTEGLPEQQFLKDYTIVTTSRPWKIHTLEISETEIQQMLKLKGFDDKSEMIMIYRTIKHINSDRGDNQDIKMCKGKLDEKSLRSLKQVPIMLQQLICLWIDGKLDKSSKCAVYTEMLELFFTWNEKKGTKKCASKPMKIDLPQYFAMKQKCKSNGHLIHDMSQLAYETLFKCTKDQSLTFDINVFDQLEISDEIRESCLKIGLLTEDRCPSLFVSEPPSTMFSFIHKSVQEFLAAVNIAINYKTKINSSNNSGNAETQIGCIQFVQEVFKKCSTVNEILEQSNVVIMLCGLEPRLATHVSRYIYDIVNKDPLVQRYRRAVDSDISEYFSDYRFLEDIQNLILESMKECNASTVENRPTFHIGDLYIDRFNDSCEIVCSSIDQQQITPDSVRSIYVDYIDTKNVKFSKYLPKFKHLEKIIINYEIEVSSSTESVDTIIDEVNKSVAETIRINTSTLKSLSLSGTVSYTDKLDSLCKNVVHLLPSMNNLVAIKMTYIIMSHHDTSRVCEFLKGTSHLEQIHIYIKCECRNDHDVDLSKHQQLQYLELRSNRMCITDIDTVNLEVFICCNIKSTNYIKIFDSIVKCDKLKKLNFNLYSKDKSVSFHTSIRDRLVSVLPLLHNLSKLELLDFRLTDNIIQDPSEMKSLKDIYLYRVRMSLTTWKKFVDSLPSIPHTVDVRLFKCDITGDGEEFNYDRLSCVGVGGEKGNEAKQYVKDQKQLFNVKHDDDLFFWFSTIK